MGRHTITPTISFFGITALVILVLYAVHPPIFMTTDDVFMRMRYGVGQIGQEAATQGIFCLGLLSRVLSVLYTHGPVLPWYGCLLILTVWISFSIAGVGLAQAFGVRVAAALFSFVLAFLLPATAWNLQFTIVASLGLCAGAIALVLGYAKKDIRWWVLGLSLYLLASSIRPVNAYLAFGVLGAVCGSSLVVLLLGRRGWRACLTSPWSGMIALLILGTLVTKLLYYTADEKAARILDGDDSYLYYHQVSSGILEYGHFDGVPEEALLEGLKEVQWSRNDYDMMVARFFWDSERYKRTVLKTLVDRFPPKQTRITWPQLYEIGAVWLQNLRIEPVLQLGIALALVLVGLRPSWLMFFSMAAVVTMVVVGHFYMALTLKMPPAHITQSFGIFIGFAAILQVVGASLVGTPSLSRKWISFPVVALAAGIVVFSIPGWLRHQKFFAAEAEKRDRLLSEAMDAVLSEDAFYFVWGGFPFYAMGPMDTFDRLEGFRHFNLWLFQRLQHENAVLKAEGIDDIYTAMLTHADARLILRGGAMGDEHYAMLGRYFLEHYQETLPELGDCIVGEVPGQFRILDLRKNR